MPRVLIICLFLAGLLSGCARQVQTSAALCCDPGMVVKDSGFVFHAVDGAALPGRIWQAEGGGEAVILALHGFGDYSRVFEEAGPWWAEQGITVYAPDQRGFGKAPGYGIWPDSDVMARDAAHMLRVIRRQHPGLPVWMLGMSMGGAVALQGSAVHGEDRPDGLLLVAPAVLRKKDLPLHYRIALWVAANLLPGLEPSGRHVRRQPTDNIPLLRRMAKDPLIYKKSRLDTVAGLIDLMDKGMTAAASPDLPPVLLLIGEKDELVEAAYTEALQKQFPDTVSVTAKSYPDGWHMLLRDLQRRKVWQDIRDHVLDRHKKGG